MEKRTLTVVLCLALALSLLAGCSAQTEVPSPAPSLSGGAVSPPPSPLERQSVTIAGLSGPTSMGLIRLISEKALNSDAYAVSYEIAAAPDELTGKLINGEVQIAALPTNTAAVLYNKTEGQLQFLALNTLGVLYLVGRDSSGIASAADLAGKSITLSGSGAVPQYAVEYILDKAGVKDSVTFNYLTDHASAAQALLGGDAELAILPQPVVTQVLAQDAGLKLLLDLTAEWDSASGGASVLSMGCLVVDRAFADANPGFIADFMAAYEASAAFVNAHPAEAAPLIADAGLVASPELAEKAIPYCNIVCRTALDAKTQISGFLQVLFDFAPASVGGALPDDGFYYVSPITE
jgi:NitT/TauT family transport system substrate-binding protein